MNHVFFISKNAQLKVGLYDEQNSLIAVGRLSSPINKNFSSEAVVKVRLTY